MHLTFPNFEHQPLKGKVSGLYTVNSTFQYFLGMNIIYAEKLHKQYKGALTILLRTPKFSQLASAKGL